MLCPGCPKTTGKPSKTRTRRAGIRPAHPQPRQQQSANEDLSERLICRSSGCPTMCTRSAPWHGATPYLPSLARRGRSAFPFVLVQQAFPPSARHLRARMLRLAAPLISHRSFSLSCYMPNPARPCAMHMTPLTLLISRSVTWPVTAMFCSYAAFRIRRRDSYLL